MLSSFVEDRVEEGVAVLGRCLAAFVFLLGGRGGGEGAVFPASLMGDWVEFVVLLLTEIGPPILLIFRLPFCSPLGVAEPCSDLSLPEGPDIPVFIRQ